MRVAYCGNFSPEWSTENDVRLAFEHLGHEVVQLQENQTSPGQLRDAALSSDLLLWTSTWDNIALYEALDVFVECARQGIPTATLHLDTFWSTARGGRKWWREAMFHTAHVFTADGDHQDKWRALGINHHWLRPGVRHSACYIGEFREEFACDVAFAGSDARPRGQGYHPEWTYRCDLVDQLEAMCERNGWSFRNPGGRQPKVERGQMNDFYASAKVTVGDSLCFAKRKARYWSDRAYEAPGRGGLLVMPQIHALDVDYDGQLPMYPWGDWAALEGIVAGLLADDAKRALTVKETHGIASERHTYVNRVTELLETVGLA